MKRTADNELPEERLNKIPALGERFKGVDAKRYQRLECVVDEAMKPGSQRPIILSIRDRVSDNTHGCHDYELAFRPSNRLVALHLLQSLDTMEVGKPYEDLVRALYDREGENDEYLDSVDESDVDHDDENTADAPSKSEKLLQRTVGTSALGELSEVHDIDEYDPFLYWHHCYLNTVDDDQSNHDPNDDDDSDDV